MTTRILLINPNTSQTTTAMMVAIARSVAPADAEILGATASSGVPMIVDAAALAASAPGVIDMGVRHRGRVAAVIVSAFGDPGVAGLRTRLDVPVIGIAEAGMREAAFGGRRFGIATVTPGLAASIDAHAAALGLAPCYTGTRLTAGDPAALAATPDALVAALGEAVARCIRDDGAEAVVIGGGPLGDAAAALAGRFGVPIIAPIPAAVRQVMTALQPGNQR